MKNFIFLTFFLVVLALTSLNIRAEEPVKKVFITVDKETNLFLSQKFGARIVKHAGTDDIMLLEVDEDAILWISMLMHQKFNRCGGFIVHEDFQEAFQFINPLKHRSAALADYSINQKELVENMLPMVQEPKIRSVIEKLSSYKNRYYKSSTGVQSQQWLKSYWEELTKGRSDVEVSLFEHRNWDQPSVIAKFQGAKNPDEVIVIGGHADSIAGFWGGARATAPGADDNASGIASITEVIRVLAESSYRPEKTIYFMAYAAEEVGLRGSKEIASTFKANNVNVVGVMQLDMTNYDGSNGKIALISDNTNKTQNEFVARILDQYITEVSWRYDKCGYACSDHASWNSMGFPASFPFESQKSEMNRNIHTSRDTITRSNGTADHASHFTKIALAFLVELDR